MINRAEIFETILQRNALRREVGLPQRPVRETYEATVRQALFHDHAQAQGDRIHAEVLHKLRLEFGADFPQSTGGRMALSLLTDKAIRESFQDKQSS